MRLKRWWIARLHIAAQIDGRTDGNNLLCSTRELPIHDRGSDLKKKKRNFATPLFFFYLKKNLFRTCSKDKERITKVDSDVIRMCVKSKTKNRNGKTRNESTLQNLSRILFLCLFFFFPPQNTEVIEIIHGPSILNRCTRTCTAIDRTTFEKKRTIFNQVD